MSRLDALGFETGVEVDSSTVGGAGGTRSVTRSSAQAKSGSNSLRVQHTNMTVAGQVTGQVNVAGSPKSLQFVVSIYVAILAAKTRVAMVQYTAINGEFAGLAAIPVDANTWKATAYMVNSANGEASLANEITGLAYNAWHSFLVQVDRDNSGTNDLVTLTYIDGRTVTLSGENRLTGGATAVLLGEQASTSHNVDVYFDDVIIDNALTFIHPATALHFLNPNAAGDAMTMTVVGGGTAQSNLSDESDTTGVRSSGTTVVRADVNTADSGISAASASVLIPAVYESVRSGNATDLGQMLVGMRLSSTDATSGLFGSDATVTTRRTFLIRTTNPSAAAWTVANIDALQLFAKNNGDGGPTAQSSVWKLWAYAEYVIAPSISDSATLTDSETLLMGLAALTDSASLAEATGIGAKFPLTQDASASEVVTMLQGKVGLADSATEVASVAVLIGVATVDSATLAEAIAEGVGLGLTDSAALTDSAGVLAGVGLTDSAATAAEEVGLLVGFLLTDAAVQTGTITSMIGLAGLTDDAVTDAMISAVLVGATLADDAAVLADIDVGVFINAADCPPGSTVAPKIIVTNKGELGVLLAGKVYKIL